MKKILAVILTFVYVFSALPAFSNCERCEGDCEAKQIKTEDHQRTTTASFKLEPLAPVIDVYGGQVQVDAGGTMGVYGYTLILSSKIPLFVRYCNFRI